MSRAGIAKAKKESQRYAKARCFDLEQDKGLERWNAEAEISRLKDAHPIRLIPSLNISHHLTCKIRFENASGSNSIGYLEVSAGWTGGIEYKLISALRGSLRKNFMDPDGVDALMNGEKIHLDQYVIEAI